MKPIPGLALILAVVIVTAGCATHYAPDVVRDPYGFFSGIWHGILLPWAVLANVVSWFAGLFGVSLFESIQIVGRPNSGFFWYYVGFALGVLTYGGAGSRKR